MSDIIGNCWHCGNELTKADYGRETNCISCGKPTRVCRNCRWYAPGRPNDCVEPTAEPVADKTKPNYCEHFEPTHNEDTKDSSADDLLKAAESLFK